MHRDAARGATFTWPRMSVMAPTHWYVPIIHVPSQEPHARVCQITPKHSLCHSAAHFCSEVALVSEAVVSSPKHPIRSCRLGIWKPILPFSVKRSRPSRANDAHEQPFLTQAALQHIQEHLAPSTDPFSDDLLRSTLIKGHLSLRHSLPVHGLRAAEICFQC